MAKSFVLNDETKVNSYGFKVLNAGIDLERFKQNPVMLSNHWNSTDNVIGRWENIRIEGVKLLADPVFDSSDPEAKKIENKVDGDFIKACSMGIRFSHKFIEEMPDSTYVLNKAELLEASIVAVPSNANSVKLYSETGDVIDDEQVKLSFQELQVTNFNKNPMSKIVLASATFLTLSAFGLKDPDNVSEIDQAVASLKAKLDASETGHNLEKQAREALQKTVDEQKSAQLNAMLDNAVNEGQILANQKETFAALGYDQAKSIVDGLPKKQSLGANLSVNGGLATDEPKTLEEFSKLSVEKQLAFKNGNEAGYKALFS